MNKGINRFAHFPPAYMWTKHFRDCSHMFSLKVKKMLFSALATSLAEGQGSCMYIPDLERVCLAEDYDLRKTPDVVFVVSAGLMPLKYGQETELSHSSYFTVEDNNKENAWEVTDLFHTYLEDKESKNTFRTGEKARVYVDSEKEFTIWGIKRELYEEKRLITEVCVSKYAA